MRLIDADKFILSAMDASLSSVDEDTILDLVDSIPTVDAVIVTRCKDCKYHYDCGVHFCNRLRMNCPDDSDFFCSYGERKDGGDG